MINLSPVIALFNTLNLLTGCLQPFMLQDKTLTNEEYERLVVFSITWAIGGVYEAEDRVRFHELLITSNAGVMPILGKEGETIFDYYVSVDSLDWMLYKSEEWMAPSSISFS